MRTIKDRQAGSTSARILINGSEYINFSSNDYLGLSGHPSVVNAAKEAIDRYGFGSGASRLLSGGTELHSKLEEMTANFKKTEAALIFSSGYTANISAIPAIAGEEDVIFSDELNHASIIDGCRLSKAKKAIYRHRDVEHISELIKKEKGKRKIIVTDSVFSMDGDIAPLSDIYNLCADLNSELPALPAGRLTQCPILLYIDDAHGTGVLGQGEGALAHFHIKQEHFIIQIGTFSKALGSYGAFIAATRNITDWLINTGRGLIYSTALPACIAGASIGALQTLQEEQVLVEKLWRNRERLFKGISELGLNTMNSETPIIPVIVGDEAATLKFSKYLMDNNIYAPAIRPPTVTVPRIRFTVTAAHTEKDINLLLEVLSHSQVH